MTFPLLAAFASLGVRSPEQAKVRKWMAFAFGLVLVPLLLVTGSRAGLVLGGIAILLSAFVFQAPALTIRPKRKAQNLWPVYGLTVFGVIGMVALAAALSRSEALDRLITPDQLEQDRFAFWPVIGKMVGTYLPFGSGFGSFVEVYQVTEPDNLLKPQYLNHSHNDYIEFALDGGAFSILLISVGLLLLIFKSLKILRRNSYSGRILNLSRLGGSLIFLILASSFVDYPIRTPIISSIFVISIIWLFNFRFEDGSNT
jgi:O-antigen ligase